MPLPPPTPADAPGDGPAPLAVAWRRKWLLLLGALLGAGAGYGRALRQPPVYQSTAQVLVERKSPDVPLVGGTDLRGLYPDDVVATSVALIRSPEVVRRAVSHLDAATPTLRAGPDPVAAVVQGLTVVREGREPSAPSAVLTLTFRGPDPADAPKVLDAVVQGFRDFLDDKSAAVGDEAARLIGDAKTTLRGDLARKQKEYDDFRKSQPVVVRPKDGASPAQERAAALEAKLTALLLRQVELDERLAWVAAATKAGRPRAEVLAALARTASESGVRLAAATAPAPGPNRLEDQLLALQIEEASLLQDYAPNHYKVRALRERAALVERAMRGAAVPAPAPAASDELDGTVALLRAERDELPARRDSLERLLAREREAVRAQLDAESRDESLRRDLAATQSLFDATVKRLTEIDLVRHANGTAARVVAPPEPGIRVGPSLLSAAALGGLLGGAAAFAAAYLLQLADHNFEGADDVRRRLGAPVLGEVPRVVSRDTLDSPLDPSLVTVLRPRSAEAEAFRAVRTALAFGLRARGHAVLQITSPNPGDGKSTLAANLAASFAQSGRRTLLIDADFRRPRGHAFFGVLAAGGLATALRDGTSAADVVVPSGVPGLWLLPCGPRPSNPGELLSSPQLNEVLVSLRAAFETVLVDTPALLSVSDAAAVAPRVDGVVLVVRPGRGARPPAERAAALLASVGAELVGVVVNGGGAPAAGADGPEGPDPLDLGEGRR